MGHHGPTVRAEVLAPLTGEIPVNSLTAGSQLLTSVLTNASGVALITWYAPDGDGRRRLREDSPPRWLRSTR